MRKAYCPLCGEENADGVGTTTAEGALCSDRCSAAFKALAMLRDRESESEALSVRRRHEIELSVPHAAALSELLLKRWRAGDWVVEPKSVLNRL